MLSHLLNLLAFLERTIYLQNTSNDKGNGFRPRKLHAGSLTLDLLVPKTRTGTTDFSSYQKSGKEALLKIS
jgi:hypothetical protein